VNVYSQDELDIVLLGLGDQVLDLFSAGLVKERLADLDAVDDLLEGKGHSSADDERVDLRRGVHTRGRRFQSVSEIVRKISRFETTTTTHLIQHVIDQLDLVLNLGPTQDGQKRPLRALQSFGEKLQLLLHQEPCGTFRQLDADHGRVRSVGGSKGVVDVDRTEGGEGFAESFDGGFVGCVRMAGRCGVVEVDDE
jgi:hypothetical protein